MGARLYGTKIIILLFWFRAGDGRAEHPFPSASTLPMHESMPNPHGLRCAVQARCNSCLVSRGDVPVGPVGPGAPPSPPPSPTVRTAARPAIFSWFPNHQIPAINFFSGHEIKPKQVRIRSSLPRARRQMRKGEAIRLSWCSATAPC